MNLDQIFKAPNWSRFRAFVRTMTKDDPDPAFRERVLHRVPALQASVMGNVRELFVELLNAQGLEQARIETILRGMERGRYLLRGFRHLAKYPSHYRMEFLLDPRFGGRDKIVAVDHDLMAKLHAVGMTQDKMENMRRNKDLTQAS